MKTVEMTAVEDSFGGGYIVSESGWNRFDMAMRKYPYFRSAMEKKREEILAWTPSKIGPTLFFCVSVDVTWKELDPMGKWSGKTTKDSFRMLIPIPIEIPGEDPTTPVIRIFHSFETFIGMEISPEDSRIVYFVPTPSPRCPRQSYDCHVITKVVVVARPTT